MLSFLSQAFQTPSMCVPKDPTLVGQPAKDASLFGELFMPQSEIEYSDFLDGLAPEFNFDGFLEEVLSVSSGDSTIPGSRKLSTQLASTQANDSTGADLEDTETVSSENLNKRSGVKLETYSALSTVSSLKKRSPNYQEDTKSEVSKTTGRFLSEFDRQTFVRSQLVNLVLNLIDRKLLPDTQLAELDSESLSMLSNFSFMIYSQTINESSLQDDLESLNAKISSKPEKKKRNEERIKYVFKRVNKIILKKHMDEHELPQEAEVDAMNQILHKYFGSKFRHEEAAGSAKDKTAFNRYFTLLFKPSNMYRNDLKDVFSFPSYLEVFRAALELEFLSEFKKKRYAKIENYLNDLRNEMFYSSDKSDPSLLQKKVSRLPWSLAEVQQGMTLFQDIFKLH